MVQGQRPTLHWLDQLLADEPKLIRWLISVKLIKSRQRCHRCHSTMKLMHKERSDRRPGSIKCAWYCRCRGERSIRRGSIFSRAKNVPIAVFVKYMYFWSNNLPGRYIGTVSPNTLRKLGKLCTEVVLHSLRTDPLTFQQGTFAVDESMFASRKNHQGRIPKQRWVFGMVDMAHPTKPMFMYVPARNAETLTALICKYIPANSTIVSDLWRGYNHIARNNNYLHLTVNHSRNFVNPSTGAHTNTIEVAWRYAKQFVRPKRPQNIQQLQTILYRYMWLKWRGESWPGGPFGRLLTDITRYYTQK